MNWWKYNTSCVKISVHSETISVHMTSEPLSTEGPWCSQQQCKNDYCSTVLAFRYHGVLWPVPLCIAQWTTECLYVHSCLCVQWVNVCQPRQPSNWLKQCVTDLCVLINMQLLSYYSVPVCLSGWHVLRYCCMALMCPHFNYKGIHRCFKGMFKLNLVLVYFKII